MPFFDKRPADLDHNDIAELIRLPESITLDFKRQLDDQNSGSILKCVTAMANTQGGRIIVGIDEDGTLASEIIGIPNDRLESVRSRLRNWCNTLIDPRIPNLDIHPVSLEGGEKSVIVISIPAPTLLAPHQEKNSKLFHKRYPAGNDPMTYQELRAMFNQAETLSRRIKEFRVERLTKVRRNLSGELPFLLPKELPRLVIHFSPIALIGTGDRIDLMRLYETNINPLRLQADNDHKRFNLDGFAFPVPTQHLGTSRGYVQVFREGMIEVVVCDYLDRFMPRNIQFVSLYTLQKLLLQASVYVRQLFDLLAIDSPVNVMVSLVEMNGFTLSDFRPDAFIHESVWDDANHVKYPEFMFPDITLEKMSDLSNPQALRPLCDLFANALGLPISPDFNSNGEFRFSARDALT